MADGRARTARELLDAASPIAPMGRDNPRFHGMLHHAQVAAAVESAEALTRIADALEQTLTRSGDATFIRTWPART